MLTEFAGFTWPKHEWTLPKGEPSQRVRKTSHTGGYYQDAPCMSGKGEIGFYWGEGGEPSGRLWTLRAKLNTEESWHCDSFQDGTITAFVFALPHGRGWLAGWTMGGEMTACVDRHIHTTESSAMREANEMARIAAEEAREEDMRDQAEQRINEAREYIKEAKASTHDLICEIKLQRLNPGATGLTTAEVLRDALCRGLTEIRELRKRIALLEREPWQAVA